jgi:hypothetical protein
MARLLVRETAERLPQLGEGAVMKKLFAVLVLAAATWSVAPAQEAASFGTFYSSLGSQGDWIAVDGGTYAWHPAGVTQDWRPYTDGQWVWTDDGWYWQTDEPWGWATYHYGRWYHDDFYGWVWVPGYEWAPAWVEWRYGGNYVGWAPLGPYAVFSMGWGIHYRRYWATPSFYWSFVDCRYITTRGIHRYVYRADENARFIGRTRNAGSVRYDNGRIISRGPERDYVERSGNIRVERADLVDVRDRAQAGMGRTGERDRVSVYRPRIDAGGRDAAGLRPDNLRMDDRKVNLDTRGTDIRRGDAGNAQRDLRKAEEFRNRSEGPRAGEGRAPSSVQPSTPRSQGPRTGYEGRVPRGERRIDRMPDQPQRLSVPPSRRPERSAPRMGTESPRPPRMTSPDRGSGRSSPPPTRDGGSTRGGGGRGGDRGRR